LSDEHYNIIKYAFPLDILENSDNLWEDVTFANMANILKIYFSGDKCIKKFSFKFKFQIFNYKISMDLLNFHIL